MPSTGPARKRKTKKKPSGKLRIGDDWNAINIIALSQSNPLKAGEMGSEYVFHEGRSGHTLGFENVR